MTKYISTFCICALLLAFSCTDPNLIGLEVQPPSDGISVALTSANNNLKLSTISEDSLLSGQASVLLLGEVYDPIFGNNQSVFATQFTLPFTSVDVGSSDTLTVDSVVLSFSYAGTYGGNNQLFDITVNELSESIFKDSVYYSNQNVTFDANAVYSQTTMINTEDSVMVGVEMKAPHLRLKLDNALGDKILDESGTSNLEDNVQFAEFFKGFYVSANVANLSGGSIVYFSPTSSNSKLSIYYHSTNVDSLSLAFSLSGDAARVNFFNEKDMSQLLQQADTSIRVYVQSMAGYKTVIEVQSLDTLKAFFKNKAINRVNLDFEVDDTETADFPPHGKLHLRILDTEEQSLGVLSENLGGNLENGKYSFNITQYFFSILFKMKYSNKLYLEAKFAGANANRTILIKDKVSFNIIYTDL